MTSKKRNLFRFFVKWGLGLHGAFHVLETAVNFYEQLSHLDFYCSFFSILVFEVNVRCIRKAVVAAHRVNY